MALVQLSQGRPSQGQPSQVQPSQGQASQGQSSQAQLAKNSHDRFGFTLFLALAVHAVIVLGITFAPEDFSSATTTLEITLAQFRSDKAPENADFAAQFNQEGSGTSEEKKLLTTEKDSPFHDTLIRDVEPEPQIEALKITTETQDNIITTISNSEYSVPLIKDESETKKEQREGEEKTEIALSEEIASIQARLDRQRQKDAKRPRIHRLTSLATKETVDAEYLHEWRNKIEIIGNLYYPEEARQKQIFGSLQLLVSLLPNGEIHDIQILQSSGSPILDEAAKATVKRAAPFDPFPAGMRQQVDQLEIIRTWRYDKENQMTAN